MVERVALITGAAQGLGLSTAERLASDGWRVCLTDRNAGVAGAAAGLPGQTLGIAADVRSAEEQRSVISAVQERWGRLDAVVANAGVGGPSDEFLDVPDADVRQVVDINFGGTLRVIRAALPLLRTSDRARIVVLGSVFAQQPVPGAGPYIASKGAVIGLMHALSLELAPSITVNAVSPGYMMTEMHREELQTRAREHGTSFEEQVEAYRSRVPLGRHGTGADIAAAVSFLLSADASYITGQTLNVNGGIFVS